MIASLMATDMILSFLKGRSKKLEKWLEGLPLIVVENGEPLKESMSHARIDEQDVLAAARQTQGLQRMDQIQYAVLEKSGGISIVPKRGATP